MENKYLIMGLLVMLLNISMVQAVEVETSIANPEVTFLTPSEVNGMSLVTIDIEVENKGEQSGFVSVIIKSDKIHFNPSSTSFYMSGKEIESFSFQGASDLSTGVGKIEITACSSDQFGQQNCDTEKQLISVVAKQQERINIIILPYMLLVLVLSIMIIYLLVKDKKERK